MPPLHLYKTQVDAIRQELLEKQGRKVKKVVLMSGGYTSRCLIIPFIHLSLSHRRNRPIILELGKGERMDASRSCSRRDVEEIWGMVSSHY